MPDEERRLVSLLRQPSEDLNVEIKNWLELTSNREHKAVLAKALIALANHGGGFLVFGFEERDNGRYVAAPGRPESLVGYSQDIINGIVSRYAEPSFHCDLDYIEHPDSGSLFPIVTVPTGSVPIRSKREGPEGRGITLNCYYIRRPGPASEPPQSAQEWSRLIRRCVLEERATLIESIRYVLEGETPIESSEQQTDEWGELCDWIDISLQRWNHRCETLAPTEKIVCPNGYWWAAYQIKSLRASATLGELKKIMAGDRTRYTGWPPWPTNGSGGVPIIAQGDGLECWMGEKTPDERDPAKADFWRASPKGFFFQLRGYQEDSGEIEEFEPGQILTVHLPIWRLGESLLHAHDMANRLGDESAEILFRTCWTGLRGRRLRIPTHIDVGFHFKAWTADEDLMVLDVSVANARIRDNLPEVVWKLLKPLYERFEFFELPRDIVFRELERMLGHRFE